MSNVLLTTSTSIYSNSWRNYGTVSRSGSAGQKSFMAARRPRPARQISALAVEREVDEPTQPKPKTKETDALLPKEDPANDEETEQVTKSVKYLRMLNLGLMSMVLVGYGMCTSIFAPFFPTEAARRGISSTTVGFVFGTFTLVMFIGSLVTGLMVRILGLNFMIGAGTLLAGASTLLFGLLDLAPPGDAYIILCFAIRVIEGAGASLYNTAAYSIASQLYPHETATVYAVLETSNGLGKMIGPSLGGALYNIGGFSLPFYLTGGLLLVFGFISMILLRMTLSAEQRGEETNEPTSKKKKGPPPLPWSHFYKTSIEIWILTIVMALTSLIFGFPQPTLAIYFESLGLSDPATVGLVFLGGSLMFTILSMAIGKLADSYPHRVYHMMTIGSIILTVSLLFFGPMPPMQGALPPSIGGTVACQVLLCTGIAIVLNPVPAAIMSAAKAAGFSESLETSAMVAGLFNAQWFLGGFAGGPIAGLLMDTVGFAWGAFILAVVSLVIVLLLLVGTFIHRIEAYKARRLYDYAIFNNESTATTSIGLNESLPQ